MKSLIPLLLSALTLAAALIAPAGAQAPEYTAAQLADILGRAEGAMARGDFQAALDLMLPVDAAMRRRGDDPGYRWNLATALAETGRPAQAAESYELFIALDVPERHREVARKRLAALDAEHLGRLELTCRPEGAIARLDAHATDPRPCPTTYPRLPAGAYRVTIRAASGLEANETIEIRPGRTSNLIVTVPPVLEIRSPLRGTQVQIEGRRVGDAGPGAPLVISTLTPGYHRVRATHPEDATTWEARRWVGAGERRVIEVPFNGRDSAAITRREDAIAVDDDDDTLLWVGVGVAAAVGVGVGAWLLLASDDAPARPDQVRFSGEL